MAQMKLARQKSSASVGPPRRNRPAQQNGSVLLVVVVLLLLASLFVLFALNVGRFEQKTSGNDMRAKLAQQLAEAGMNQGVEFFNANRAIVADTAQWELCNAADLTFPCGAVPELGTDLPDPDGAGPLPDPPAVARRDTMYRFIGGTGTGGRLVAIPNPIAATGGFDAAQQVGAVLCRVAVPATATAPTECATDPDEASSTWVLTVVSKGMLTGEGSSATVTQTIGAYNIFAPNLGLPPVLASGSVGVGGGIQIVTAPNAAGTGVPVSVWTRLEMTKNGTPNTCYMEEFLREGGTSSGPQYYQDIMVCHTCKCPGDGSLSYPKSGGQACQGMDIVDIDNNEPNDCGIAPNLDIRRSEFPADLFAFLFGVNGWADLDQGAGGDTYANKEFNFAESRLVASCTYPHPATGALVTSAGIPADTCYLLNIKNKIHIGDGINDAAECAAIGPGSSGLIWVHEQAWDNAPGYDCTTSLRGEDQIGTPNDPVALVFDGSLTQVHFQLYGLLFVREPNGSTTLDENTGGSAEFGMNAGATIYGAVVVQGSITSGGGGTAAIVYNADVLQNLFDNPDFFEPSSIAGSWTDKMRY